MRQDDDFTLSDSLGDASIEHPQLLAKVQTALAKRRRRAKPTDAIDQVLSEEYGGLSQRLDESEVQESCTVRHNLKTRRLALTLLNGKGELVVDRLTHAIRCLKRYLYPLGPGREHDIVRQEHMLAVLEGLQKSKELRLLLKSIGRPLGNRQAEAAIRDTLQLDSSVSITDVHARSAVLAAMLCYLRQNVGSCFATAPAILIQQEFPFQFLRDVKDLFEAGRLKRVTAGVEYTVPISASWGVGDLRKSLIVAREERDNLSPVWKSPGLLVALTAAGIVSETLPLAQKTEQCKSLVFKYLSQTNSSHPFVFTTIETLLRWAILDHLSLTEQDISDFENRPRAMIYSGLLMQTTQGSGSMGGKGKQCATFKETLETAKRSFKSLTENAILKSWEFSLASLSEAKANFSKWNLYSSLGMAPKDVHGIGGCLYGVLKDRLDRANALVQEFNGQCEQVYGHLQYLEGKMRRASTEQELHWVKAEYQQVSAEFHHYQSLRDEAHEKASRVAGLFDQLIDVYLEAFPRYFQEVYDAEMHDVTAGPYDDTPAGFRLLYKAGRAATAQWSPIGNVNEFVEALVGFFVMTENEVVRAPEFEGMEKEIGEIVTAIVAEIRTREFIEASFDRMAVAHGVRPVSDPLNNLDKVEKKPWVYTSGGTMNTLVSAYFSREESPTEMGRWVENPKELFAFFIDVAKQLPSFVAQQFVDNPNKSLLVHSPTHAFLFKPGLKPFVEGWHTEEYTYTWIKERYIQSRQRYVEGLELNRSAMRRLLTELMFKVPETARPLWNKAFSSLPYRLSCEEFRDLVWDTLSTDRGLWWHGVTLVDRDVIDSVLYAHVPLFPKYKLRELLEEIFRHLPCFVQRDVKEVLSRLDWLEKPASEQDTITSKQLREIVVALVMLNGQCTSYPKNLFQEVVGAMQGLSMAMPAPVLFADSNWTKDYFGFVVSPATGNLELWRLDRLGVQGSPMSAWKQWVDGSRKDRTWGVYVKPGEYQLSAAVRPMNRHNRY